MPNKSKAEMLAEIEQRYQIAMDNGDFEELKKVKKDYQRCHAKWNHWKDRWTYGQGNPFGTLMPIDGEKWILLTDRVYASPYAVSDFGRIFDFARGKIMKPYKGSQDGEYKVSFNANADEAGGKNRLIRNVKKVVADAFIPNPFNVRGVGFKDGNPQNFSADNLVRYETPYDKRWGIKAE